MSISGNMLLHIVPGAEWESARAAGVYRPVSLAAEGFIHLSHPFQVLFAADTFYRGKNGLVLLVIDAARLSAPLRHDNVPGHGTFPHLYCPLNPDAVVDVLPFPPKPDGTFALPGGLAVAG